MKGQIQEQGQHFLCIIVSFAHIHFQDYINEIFKNTAKHKFQVLHQNSQMFNLIILHVSVPFAYSRDTLNCYSILKLFSFKQR